jgi:hypothetical protein
MFDVAGFAVFSTIWREMRETLERMSFQQQVNASRARNSEGPSHAERVNAAARIVRLDGSYFASKFCNWIVTAGSLDRWWGRGWEGSYPVQQCPADYRDREWCDRAWNETESMLPQLFVSWRHDFR